MNGGNFIITTSKLMVHGNTYCSIMSHFDERSGVVYCSTSWGQWGQTIEEVFIEVDVVEGTRPRDIQCEMKPKSLSVTVNNKEILKVYIYTVSEQSKPT